MENGAKGCEVCYYYMVIFILSFVPYDGFLHLIVTVYHNQVNLNLVKFYENDVLFYQKVNVTVFSVQHRVFLVSR